ncbi:hypothetical protein D3C80_979750 [compost metagenome]
MHKAEQILVGITEAHAAADTGFKVGSRTGHVECNHTLIWIPNVNHTVQFVVVAVDLIFGQQVFPISCQFF